MGLVGASRKSPCLVIIIIIIIIIAAHYKIVPITIANKLAIKIICDKKWRVCFISLIV